MEEEMIKNLCRIIEKTRDKKLYLDTVRGYDTMYSTETASEALEDVMKQLNNLLFVATLGKKNYYPLLPREVRSMVRYAQSR